MFPLRVVKTKRLRQLEDDCETWRHGSFAANRRLTSLRKELHQARRLNKQHQETNGELREEIRRLKRGVNNVLRRHPDVEHELVHELSEEVN